MLLLLVMLLSAAITVAVVLVGALFVFLFDLCN